MLLSKDPDLRKRGGWLELSTVVKVEIIDIIFIRGEKSNAEKKKSFNGKKKSIL